MSTAAMEEVVIVGGVRTPFCRSNTSYRSLTNLDLLSCALQGVVDAFGLEEHLVDEIFAGAITTHSKDWNLAREASLSTTLPPRVPAVTLMQACGTSLQAALILAAKISAGQIQAGIAAGTDTTSDVPLVLRARLARHILDFSRARSVGERVRIIGRLRAKDLLPQPPRATEPRTGLSMGQHCELMARAWGISRQAQDEYALESHRKAAAAYQRGALDRTLVPCAGILRDNTVRADTTLEQLATLRTVFESDDAATLTAGNSTPLTDGASAIVLANERWARDRGLPILAHFTYAQSAAVDFVGGAGLLMAPTLAMARMLEHCGRALDSFEIYEIHEAFAAQVLCTLAAWEDPEYCRRELGQVDALGSIDRKKLNPRGSSLAYGHPFAATGARLLLELADQLAEGGGGSGVVSVCTAGGMGLTAILER